MKKMIKNYRFIITILPILFLSTCSTTNEFFATVNISEDIFFDDTEVSVMDWLAYYTWILENKGLEEANSVLPDSSAIDFSIWIHIKSKSTVYSKRLARKSLMPVGYFMDKCGTLIKESCPSYYLYYPITGISFEQVIGYCKWRTMIMNNHPTFSSFSENDYTVTYRLPTESEWMHFAKKGMAENYLKNGYPDSTIFVKNKQINNDCSVFNYKNTRIYTGNLLNKIAISGSFLPDKNKSYDVFGNVSEMTSTKGIAKGGNYLLYASQCNVDSIQNYSKPEKWLGFRCIAVKQKISSY